MYHVCDYPYYSCLGTFWHCHPYFTLQFYANVFILVLLFKFGMYHVHVIVVLWVSRVYGYCTLSVV